MWTFILSLNVSWEPSYNNWICILLQVVTDDHIDMKFAEIVIKKKSSTKTNDTAKEKRVKKVNFIFYTLLMDCIIIGKRPRKGLL